MFDRRVWLLTATLLWISAVAHAQSQAPAGPTFVAADFFGGLSVISISGEEDEIAAKGWEVGSTLRFQPWWGIKAGFARTKRPDSHQWQYLGGLEVATKHGLSGNAVGRGFAHALVGYIKERATDGGGSKGSPELVLGAGLDVLFFFRLQVDYARVNLPTRSKNNVRVFVGGVVPLCFKGCDANWEYGIPIRQ